MKSRVSFRENYLILAIENGLVKMIYPDSPTNLYIKMPTELYRFTSYN
ncbi:MAG: hypothetical protein RSC85_02825 [Bacilli bacterium]